MSFEHLCVLCEQKRKEKKNATIKPAELIYWQKYPQEIHQRIPTTEGMGLGLHSSLVHWPFGVCVVCLYVCLFVYSFVGVSGFHLISFHSFLPHRPLLYQTSISISKEVRYFVH